MDLILSRHGNTFGPLDPVVWTGASNDLPLVEKGIQQAEKFAHALKIQRVRPAAVYCSPLQRTSKYAGVVIQKLKLPLHPIIDSRLHEVDYGDWTGLTNEQVIARFGEAELKAWDSQSQWPSQGNWGGSEEAVISEVQSFATDLVQRHAGQDGPVVVITSNGRLRYFLTLIAGEFEKNVQAGTFKVKTGNVCRLSWNDGVWSLLNWNIDPSLMSG